MPEEPLSSTVNFDPTPSQFGTIVKTLVNSPTSLVISCQSCRSCCCYRRQRNLITPHIEKDFESVINMRFVYIECNWSTAVVEPGVADINEYSGPRGDERWTAGGSLSSLIDSCHRNHTLVIAGPTPHWSTMRVYWSVFRGQGCQCR